MSLDTVLISDILSFSEQSILPLVFVGAITYVWYRRQRVKKAWQNITKMPAPLQKGVFALEGLGAILGMLASFFLYFVGIDSEIIAFALIAGLGVLGLYIGYTTLEKHIL